MLQCRRSLSRACVVMAGLNHRLLNVPQICSLPQPHSPIILTWARLLKPAIVHTHSHNHCYRCCYHYIISRGVDYHNIIGVAIILSVLSVLLTLYHYYPTITTIGVAFILSMLLSNYQYDRCCSYYIVTKGVAIIQSIQSVLLSLHCYNCCCQGRF